MASKDYYKILELQRTATEADVKSAYRRLARKYHPDVNPNDNQAEERFKEVGEAYEVLSNAEKRRKYDQWGADWEKYDKAGAGSYSGWSGGSGYNTKDNGFGDIFDQIFGKTRNKPPQGQGYNTTTFNQGNQSANPRSYAARPQKGEDREQQIELTLEECYNGTLRQLQIQSSDICNLCNGTGLRSGQRCSNCAGLGIVPRTKRLEVRIPAGVEESSRVRVAGEGGAGIGGGQRGDLFLKVHVQPHPQFERKGNDLHTSINIPVYTAILGGEAEVTSLKGGKFILNIPEETPNGKVFRLSGQGIPILNQPGVRGDLYIKLTVVLPSNLTVQEKELFRKLKEQRPD